MLIAEELVEQVQREDLAEDHQAYYDGLVQFYRDRSRTTVIPRSNELPSTGSSKKLHPYLVTLTPDYKTANAVVVKVNTFEDTRLPNSFDYETASNRSGV